MCDRVMSPLLGQWDLESFLRSAIQSTSTFAAERPSSAYLKLEAYRSIEDQRVAITNEREANSSATRKVTRYFH